VWGLVDDITLRAESESIRRALSQIQSTNTSLASYEPPAQLLRSIGSIVKTTTKGRRVEAMTLFGQFCEAAFEHIEADGTRLISIEPKAEFAPIFGAASASQVVRTGAAKRT